MTSRPIEGTARRAGRRPQPDRPDRRRRLRARRRGRRGHHRQGAGRRAPPRRRPPHARRRSSTRTARSGSCAAPATTGPATSCPGPGPAPPCPAASRSRSARSGGRCPTGCCAPSRELGISDDHEGILILPAETAVGLDIRDVLGLDDVIFDLEITPNRPDAMSVAGVARDLAAALGLPFTLTTPLVAGARHAAVGRLGHPGGRGPRPLPPLRGPVRHGDRRARRPTGWPSASSRPGMRPISNVVDVTNYVMLERGQPLHAFDLGLLGGRGIVVRMAGDGETHHHPGRGHADPRRRRPPDLRRRARAPGHRRRDGRGRLRGIGRHHRGAARVGLLHARGHPADLEAPRAADRVERPLRAGGRPQRRRHRRRPGHGSSSPRWPGVRPPPAPSTPTPPDRAGPGPPAHRPGQRRAGHRPPSRAGPGLPRAPGADGRRRRTAPGTTSSTSSFPPTGPTSSGRSTSSRRSPATTATTTSPAPCPA